MLKLLSIVVLAIILFYIQSGYRKLTMNHKTDCLYDYGYEFLADLNEAVNSKSHATLAKFLQISSSLLMDISVVLVFVLWVRNSETMRMPFMVFLFYASRALV